MYKLPKLLGVEKAFASSLAGSSEQLLFTPSSKLVPGCKLCSITGGCEAGLRPNIQSIFSKYMYFVVTLFFLRFSIVRLCFPVGLLKKIFSWHCTVILALKLSSCSHFAMVSNPLIFRVTSSNYVCTSRQMATSASTSSSSQRVPRTFLDEFLAAILYNVV